jgi:hypothetical protein
MLVENKFIYISLPRCASTSFYITCLRNNLDTKFFNQAQYNASKDRIDLNLSNEDLADFIIHSHERLSDITSKFGNDYDIIAVKRDRYVRFISSWKHLIDLVDMQYHPNLSKKLKELSVDDIMFYNSEDLISNPALIELIHRFAKRNGFSEYLDNYLTIMLGIVFKPMSWWHHHNPKVKWFDFNKLEELEEWVSNKIDKPFKLEKSNSSKHFECNLILNDRFINKYNSIYDYYDIPKQQKTLI